MQKDKSNEKIIAEAKEFHKAIMEKQSYMREVGEKCQRYAAGDQWDSKAKKAREDADRPVITVNKLAGPLDYQINKMNESRSRIKYLAKNNDDKDIVEVYNGMVRHIEHGGVSNGAAAYRHADKCLNIYGFGYYRINTPFEDEMSMDQTIAIEKIDDPLSVFMDPEKRDKCLITETLSKKEYESKYGEIDHASWENQDEWVSDNDVTLAEWWVTDYIPTTLYKIRRPKAAPLDIGNGTPGMETVTLTEEELSNYEGEYEEIQSRKTKIPKVTQYYLSPNKILDKTEWPGKYLPIIGVYGDWYKDSTGRKFPKSMIYDALEPQDLLNYNKSGQAETMQEAPISIPVVAEGQVDDYQKEWQNPKAYTYVRYKPIAVNGQVLPPPAPFPKSNNMGEYTQSVVEYDEDIKATTKVYNPTLGQNPRGESGRALIAQQDVTNLSLAHFSTNSKEAQRLAGIVIRDLFRHVYDEPGKIVKILGEDMREKVVTLNEVYKDQQGQQKFYDLRKDVCCDVVVTSTYSAGTRRKEIVESLLEYAERFPAAQQVISDMVAENLDMEKSNELALRMRATIPPELWSRIEEMKQEEERGVPPGESAMKKMGMAMQQMQQQLLQTTEDAKKLFQENESLKKKNDEIKLEVERVRQQGDIREEQIRRDSAMEVERMKQDGALERELIKTRQ